MLLAITIFVIDIIIKNYLYNNFIPFYEKKICNIIYIKYIINYGVFYNVNLLLNNNNINIIRFLFLIFLLIFMIKNKLYICKKLFNIILYLFLGTLGNLVNVFINFINNINNIIIFILDINDNYDYIYNILTIIYYFFKNPVIDYIYIDFSKISYLTFMKKILIYIQPVFNLSDILITIGSVKLIFYFFRKSTFFNKKKL